MRLLTQIIAIAILTTLAGSPAAGQDEAPDYSREGADSCLACHENEAVLALFRCVHANPSDPRGPFGHGQLQCEACHGASGSHAGRVRRGQERPAPLIAFGVNNSVDEMNGACLGCHEEVPQK